MCAFSPLRLQISPSEGRGPMRSGFAPIMDEYHQIRTLHGTVYRCE
jgi:hypothetical protein